MRVTFLGATLNVTGSRFLVEHNQTIVLVDCGLFQERAFLSRNWEDFPVDPARISAVLLTHAHLDHSGYLPKLVREGFKGKIICTTPTAEIAKVVLLDSGHLQEHDTEAKIKRHQKERRKSTYPEVPLYTVEDVTRTLPQFASVPFGQRVSLSPTLAACFYDAGHILGASMVELALQDGGKEKRFIFSGDIGRWERPLLNDPTLFTAADFVCMESTYGDREHEDESIALEKLAEAVKRAAADKGNIVIPSFAIERTQELLYYLNMLMKKGKIPALRVFIDSPMAIEILEIFKKFPQYLDQEARTQNNEHALFDLPRLTFTKTHEDSKSINHVTEPYIVIAGSGMCTGGRIKYHLLNNISRRESTILFVGYQAEGTLGRAILEKPDAVRILGSLHKVRATIEKINGFSGHADKKELLKWIGGFRKSPQKVFSVHGEAKAMNAFVGYLKQTISGEVIMPEYKSTYEL